MIRVSKEEKPQALIDNEANWTNEYLNARAAGGKIPDSIRYRYRHPEVKKVLRAEAHNKCIYCEQKVSPGETDHILPVSTKPELIVAWENLGLACKDCNNLKGDYFSEEEPLINPFVDDAGEHIRFYGPLVVHKTGDSLGFRTVEKIRLRRTELFERRKERLERIQGMIDAWHALPDGPTKELAKDKIVEEALSDKEYSATVATYLYQSLGWEIDLKTAS